MVPRVSAFGGGVLVEDPPERSSRAAEHPARRGPGDSEPEPRQGPAIAESKSVVDRRSAVGRRELEGLDAGEEERAANQGCEAVREITVRAPVELLP
jgi:hypothetical protein